ncbi:MAG: TfoX/Sxy family protein [Planctomycetota bacterium]
MAFDPKFAERIRRALDGVAFEEKRMFGGIAFLHQGHMFVGVTEDRLMLRLGPDRAEVALKRKHVAPMDFTGKPMKGYVFVAREGLGTAAQLRGWMEQALAFVGELPPKPAKPKKSGR